MAVRDAASRQVIRRELDGNTVAWKNADVICPHFAGQMAKHIVAILELDGEHRVRKRVNDFAIDGDCIGVCAPGPLFNWGRGACCGSCGFAVLRGFSCQKHILRSSGNVDSIWKRTKEPAITGLQCEIIAYAPVVRLTDVITYVMWARITGIGRQGQGMPCPYTSEMVPIAQDTGMLDVPGH
jgi:hypothetical protein